MNLTLEEEFVDLILQHKPRSLALSAYCGYLIEQALTGSVTYPRAVLARETNQLSRSSTPSVSSSTASVEQEPGSSGVEQTAVLLEPKSSTETIDSTVRKSSRTQGSDEFQAFWKLYQSCSLKANTQRKNKAWDEWRKAIKIETPERLTEALENAIAAIKRGQNIDGWAAPLPDCFRWLRDGCYTAALEEAPQTSQTSQSGRITFL